jgi:copper chaperone CopZ
MINPMQKVTYQVSGLHCGACVNRVKNALLGSASEVEVTLNPPRAILSNPAHSLLELNQKLAEVGDYQLTEASESGASGLLTKAKQWLKPST